MFPSHVPLLQSNIVVISYFLLACLRLIARRRYRVSGKGSWNPQPADKAHRYYLAGGIIYKYPTNIKHSKAVGSTLLKIAFILRVNDWTS